MSGMKMRMVLAGMIFAAMFYAGTAAAQDKDMVVDTQKMEFQLGDTILKVGDKDITHMALYKELYRRDGRQVLNDMAENLIILQEAEDRGEKVKDKDIDEEIDQIKKQLDSDQVFMKFLANRNTTLARLRKQIEINILKRRMIIKDENLDVSRNEISEYFEKNKQKFATPEQVKISHIMVESEDEAKDILVALEAGADFEKLAKAKSIDASTRDNGGGMGTFRRGMLRPELEEKIFAMKPGLLKEPYKTENGWHVVKIDEKIEPKEAKLDKDLKKRIEDTLLNQKINETYPEWIKGLSEKWIKKK